MITNEHIHALIQKKQYDEAETFLQNEIYKNENPQPQTYYLMGVLRYFQGNVGESIGHLKRCLELDPKHTDGAICLSVLYNDIGKYDQAKSTFNIANQSVNHKRPGEDYSVDRKFSVKHLELADLYFRYRRYDESIEEYNKAALLDPITLEIRIRRAKAYAKKGFMTRAMQDLVQIKRENSMYIPARIQLGLLHYSQSNLLEAELEWESILQIDPGHREATAYIKMIRDGGSRPNLTL